MRSTATSCGLGVAALAGYLAGDRTLCVWLGAAGVLSLLAGLVLADFRDRKDGFMQLWQYRQWASGLAFPVRDRVDTLIDTLEVALPIVTRELEMKREDIGALEAAVRRLCVRDDGAPAAGIWVVLAVERTGGAKILGLFLTEDDARIEAHRWAHEAREGKWPGMVPPGGIVHLQDVEAHALPAPWDVYVSWDEHIPHPAGGSLT